VKEITYDEAKRVILTYEYLGKMSASTRHSFGLFFGNYLAGVECFGSTGGANVAESVCGPEHAAKVITLVRGACTGLWAHPHSASFLISAACRAMTTKGYHIFVAYSDPDAFEYGTVYQASGWAYCSMTNPTEKYKTTDGIIHDSRQISGRTRDRRGGGLRYKRPRAEEKQILIDQGCEFSKGSPKRRYVGFYGNKQITSQLRKALRWKTLPYPKRLAEAAFGPQPVPSHTQEEPSQAS
jgi:hypothetical protein